VPFQDLYGRLAQKRSCCSDYASSASAQMVEHASVTSGLCDTVVARAERAARWWRRAAILVDRGDFRDWSSTARRKTDSQHEAAAQLIDYIASRSSSGHSARWRDRPAETPRQHLNVLSLISRAIGLDRTGRAQSNSEEFRSEQDSLVLWQAKGRKPSSGHQRR
jgi:hypothetical protein